MPRGHKAVRPDFAGQLLLRLQGGPVSWSEIELTMARAAIGLIEEGKIELVTIAKKSYLRLAKEEGAPT